VSTNLTSDGKLRRLDNNRGALVSQDIKGLEAYKKKKAIGMTINKLDQDVRELKSDVAEIKAMLQKIMTGRLA
jgi:hypothetical protein